MTPRYLAIALLFFIILYWLNTPGSKQSFLPPAVYLSDNLNSKAVSIISPHLKDITLQAGIQQAHIQRSEQLTGIHESLGSGACAFDYDNDGWMDLLTLNGSGTTHFFGQPQWWQAEHHSLTLYKNNKDGTFSDVTAASKLINSTWTMGCAHGDIDNDGDQDIFISNYSINNAATNNTAINNKGTNQLWRNNGDGTFTDTSKSSGIAGDGPQWSTSVSFADINRDGLLDIYVNNFIAFTSNSLTFEATSGYEASIPENFNPSLHNGQANQLFINQGDFTFTEHAQDFGIANAQGRSLSSQWLDINNDAYLDLLIANAQGSANKVFLNQAGKGFKDVSTASHLGFVDKASSITAADFNNDQQVDIFLSTDHRLSPKLYSPSAAASSLINTSANTSPANSKPSYVFTDRSHNYSLHSETPINQSHWGSIAADVNLDGWLDIFIANGISTPDSNAPLIAKGQPNTLLLNNKGVSFVNYSQSIAKDVYPSFSSRCALSTDINNDGAPDIYVSNNNGLGQLLLNTIDEHQWLGIDLKSNQGVTIGAKVTVDLGNSNISNREIGDSDHPTSLVRYVGNQSSFLCAGDQRLIFGLGDKNSQSHFSVTVDWPNGEKQVFKNLPKNHYHRLTQSQSQSQIVATAKKNKASNIRIALADNKLIVTQWLIKQQHFLLAEHELRLLSQHADAAVRLSALITSQQLPHSQRNIFLSKAIVDDDKKNQLQAIDFIRNNEDELLTRWLLQKLKHDDADISCASAEAFAHFFDEEEAFLVYQMTSLSALIRLATSPNKQKRLCAINALGKSEHYRALQVLTQILQDNDEDIRLAAISNLGLLKEKAIIPFLMTLVNDNNEVTPLRAAALIAIKQIDSHADITQLLNLKPNLNLGPVNNRQAGNDDGLIEVLNYAYYRADNNLLIREELASFIRRSPQAITESKPEAKTNPRQTQPHDNVFSCDKLFDAVNIPLTVTKSLKNNVTTNATIEFFTRCLKTDVFYKELPDTLRLSLQTDSASRLILLPLIAPRKERWAREIVLSTLGDKQAPLSLKKTLLNHLPNTLSVGLLRELKALLLAEPQADLAPFIAKELLNKSDNEFVLLLSERIEKQLQASLLIGDHARSLALAEALVDVAPTVVFERILISGSQNEH